MITVPRGQTNVGIDTATKQRLRLFCEKYNCKQSEVVKYLITQLCDSPEHNIPVVLSENKASNNDEDI